MWVWILYQLERWVLRGSFALVAMMIAILAVLAVLGATVAFNLPAGYFASYYDALWWAVLRLSDTGYLSDDTGGLELRALSIILSVFGMSVTVGGIVAIVAQFMNRGLRLLSMATTRVPFSGHVVILGFSDRTPRLIQDLIAETKFKIVVLVDTVDEVVQRRVNRAITKAFERERVVLRSGSSRRPAELEHAACSRARAIIVPATTQAVAGDPEAGPRILQTMLALKQVVEPLPEPPQVSVEVVDRNLAPMVSSVFPAARVLQSDRLVARVFRFALQGPNLVDFALDVIEPGRGFRMEEVAFPELLGTTLGEAERRLVGGRLMGIYSGPRGTRRQLLMDPNTRIDESSRLLVFTDVDVGLNSAEADSIREIQLEVPSREMAILVLGWNESAPDLLAELNLEQEGRYRVDFVAKVPVADRCYEIDRLITELRVKVRHFAFDPMDVDADDETDLGSYDRVLILADRSVPPEGADVRTLAVVLSLNERRSEMKRDAYVLVELLEDENAHVLGDVQAVITARLAADTLTSLALTPGADDTLQMSLGHQLTYVTRIIELKDNVSQDTAALVKCLRQKNMGYLYTFAGTRRVLACEAVNPVKARRAGPGPSSGQDEDRGTGVEPESPLTAG